MINQVYPEKMTGKLRSKQGEKERKRKKSTHSRREVTIDLYAIMAQRKFRMLTHTRDYSQYNNNLPRGNEILYIFILVSLQSNSQAWGDHKRMEKVELD